MDEHENDIAWLLEYLQLKLGEPAQAFTAKDLAYVREYVLGGVPHQYWSYPNQGAPCWVTIKTHAGMQSIGLTDLAPPARRVG